MPVSVEKIYSDALFSILSEEENGSSAESAVTEYRDNPQISVRLTDMLAQLEGIDEVFSEVPEFITLINAPTIQREEKMQLLDSAFEGKVSPVTLNFLKVLADKHRIGYFSRIYKEFRSKYNDVFKIVEITITTISELNDEMRQKIKDKMTAVTGKTVLLKEKTDSTLIGGIVLDYQNTRFDGSVKTRLEALKSEIKLDII